ncbi:ankyrin, partial [Wilcoxina mikolae CBS 423.85]
KGHEATVRLLLDLGVDKECQDNSGQRALHHAVKNGHETIAELLLQNGATRAARDKQGRTPLRLAILKWRVRTSQSPLH